MVELLNLESKSCSSLQDLKILFSCLFVFRAGKDKMLVTLSRSVKSPSLDITCPGYFTLALLNYNLSIDTLCPFEASF